MRRTLGPEATRTINLDPLETNCQLCGASLWVWAHRSRTIQRLDEILYVLRRDKRCPNQECPGRSRIYRALDDLRLALPEMTFGLDVVLEVGRRHTREQQSLRAIGRALNDAGVEISQTSIGKLFRVYMALGQVAEGDEESLRQRLREQGGIVLMIDGVQFDDRSPVLYLAWDALSGTPLFGLRKEFRSEQDLQELAERVRDMDIPVIAIVTDKEKGLVPALKSAFPGVPYQLCQLHFLKNCAKPLKADCSMLGGGVAERAEKVRKIAKKLNDQELRSEEPIVDETGEREAAKDLCDIVRRVSKKTGKAPFKPTELLRHDALEEVRDTVERMRRAREGGSIGYRKDEDSSPRRARPSPPPRLVRGSARWKDKAGDRHPR